MHCHLPVDTLNVSLPIVGKAGAVKEYPFVENKPDKNYVPPRLAIAAAGG